MARCAPLIKGHGTKHNHTVRLLIQIEFNGLTWNVKASARTFVSISPSYSQVICLSIYWDIHLLCLCVMYQVTPVSRHQQLVSTAHNVVGDIGTDRQWSRLFPIGPQTLLEVCWQMNLIIQRSVIPVLAKGKINILGDTGTTRQPRNSLKRISRALQADSNSDDSIMWKQTCYPGFSHLSSFHPTAPFPLSSLSSCLPRTWLPPPHLTPARPALALAALFAL